MDGLNYVHDKGGMSSGDCSDRGYLSDDISQDISSQDDKEMSYGLLILTEIETVITETITETLTEAASLVRTIDTPMSTDATTTEEEV